MKRASIAVAVLVALTLTGCAGTPESTATEPTQANESAAPLTAETETPDAEVGTDEAYLADVRAALEANGGSSIPDATDEQLIAAGQDACEQMLAGTDQFDVRVIEGEQAGETGYVDSLRIAGVAVKHYCPDVRAEG